MTVSKILLSQTKEEVFACWSDFPEVSTLPSIVAISIVKAEI